MQTTTGNIAVRIPPPASLFHFLRASASAGRSLTGRSGTARYCVTIQEIVPTIKVVQNALEMDSKKPNNADQ